MKLNFRKGNPKVPFLFLNTFLFLCFYCFLLFFNRYAADDYFFVSTARSKGISGLLSFAYLNWTSRPSVMFLMGVFGNYFQERTALIIYGSLTLLLLVLAIQKLFRLMSNSQMQFLTYSTLFCQAFFFASVSIGETWFWLCSSLSYLLSLVAFLWGLVFLFNGKRNSSTWILLLLSCVYVIGAAESFAVFVFMLCIAALLFAIFASGKNTIIRTKETMNLLLIKLIVVSLFFLIGLSFIYFGPGTQIRKTILRQAGFIETLYLPVRTMVYLAVKKLPSKLPLLLLFTTPFAQLGSGLKNTLTAERLFNSKSLIRILLLILLLIYFSLLPACYLIADRGPERSFTIVSFLLVILFCYLAAYWGYKIQDRIQRPLLLIALTCSSLVLAVLLTLQFRIAPAYSRALDKRIGRVAEEKKTGRKEVLNLDPLPPSGYYYSAELAPDTAYYSNRYFRLEQGLNFNCKVEKGILH